MIISLDKALKGLFIIQVLIFPINLIYKSYRNNTLTHNILIRKALLLALYVSSLFYFWFNLSFQWTIWFQTKMVRFLSIIFDHILDFADNTAIHGPRYISEKRRPVIERLVTKIVNWPKKSNAALEIVSPKCNALVITNYLCTSFTKKSNTLVKIIALELLYNYYPKTILSGKWFHDFWCWLFWDLAIIYLSLFFFSFKR